MVTYLLLLQNGCQQHRLDSYFTKEYSDVLDGIDWDDTFIDINSQPQTHLQVS